MEVLHPNPVNFQFSGSFSMASPFPSTIPQTFSQQQANYVPFFDNNIQTNYSAYPSQPSINFPNVYSSANLTNNNYVNNFPINITPSYFGNENFTSWNNFANHDDGRRGIKRKSTETDPDIPSHQKKTRSWYSCVELDHQSIDETSHLPAPSDDSSKQIIVYQGSSITNNDNNKFLKTLFESSPLPFFPKHQVHPDTQKALVQVGKSPLLSVWDTPDDSEPERELIKSPRIVELTEDDLDTGEEHIQKVPHVIEAPTPTVSLPNTPPTSPPRSTRVSPPLEEDEDEEVIVDELDNVVRISKPKSQVVIEEIHDEPLPAELEAFQGMDIE